MALLPPYSGHRGWLAVRREDREFVRAAVWQMFLASYGRIGLILSDAAELDEYDVWEVHKSGEDTLDAFVLSKRTGFGLKLGLAGTDRTAGGKAALKARVASTLGTEGRYAEVSEAMERLAVDADAPAVCAAEAANVLKKQVKPLADGLRYERVLANVGPKVKLLVGRPEGIPVTRISAPSCPAPMAGLGRVTTRTDTSREARIADATAMLDVWD